MRFSGPNRQQQQRENNMKALRTFFELVLAGIAAVVVIFASAAMVALSIILSAAPYALAILFVLWVIGVI